MQTLHRVCATDVGPRGFSSEVFNGNVLVDDGDRSPEGWSQPRRVTDVLNDRWATALATFFALQDSEASWACGIRGGGLTQICSRRRPVQS
jgi:hypothetical protein